MISGSIELKILIFFWFDLFLRDRIIPGGAPGMAAKHPPHPQIGAFEWTVNLDGLDHVGGTGGDMAARCRSQWRDGIFVKIDQSENRIAKQF